MGMRLPSMHMLWMKLQVNVFMVSYRGYGRSEGEPDEKGIKMDADAVISHLSARKDIDSKRIIILGRSLGGAVGVYVASRSAQRPRGQRTSSSHVVRVALRWCRFPDKVQGLVLENTFTSIADMVTAPCPSHACSSTSRRRISPAFCGCGEGLPPAAPSCAALRAAICFRLCRGARSLLRSRHPRSRQGPRRLSATRRGSAARTSGSLARRALRHVPPACSLACRPSCLARAP
jgi:pimeloyl-ACP methyl ester carboxylesterase